MVTAKTKVEWRTHVLALRSAMSPTEQQDRSRRIRDFALCELTRGSQGAAVTTASSRTGVAPRALAGGGCVVALYKAVRGEADVLPLAPILRDCGFVTVVPVARANRTLQFIRIDNETLWRQGAFRIPEPVSGDVVDSEHLSVVLVPGVAFDLRGFRIGYGGGFYDTLFANPKVDAWRIGVCYNFQLIRDDLPNEPHDARLHTIVTDEEVACCGPQSGTT